MERVPSSFTTIVKARGLTDNSIRLYTYYCETLVEYFSCGPRKIETRDVLEWIPYAQSELQWHPRTINLALASFRILFESVGRVRVMAGVRNLRFDHPEPIVLSASEVGSLFTSAETLTMRVAISLLYGAGLRISEMLALRFQDIDSSRGVLRIARPKNRHARDAILPSATLGLLRELWKMRRGLGPVRIEDPIFVSRKGKVLRRDVIANELVRCAERAGIRKRVYPHLLRHSFATSLIEAGTDVTTVQKLLGHRSLSSTARYVHLTAATWPSLVSPIDTVLGRPTK
jgi:site-specific recombinase XerD